MSRSWRVSFGASELRIGFAEPARAVRSVRQSGQGGLVDPSMGDLGRLEKRLLAEFCPPLPPDEVRGRLLACVASYHAAVVRTSVPLLIERTAREQLRALVANRNV